ncbi:uncharacterized protein LOC121752883 [Salvia splendens]|uniref:uncharacterized protein LOC121752883 n=1 Tax=Salvia splendens TaxID=180675 RepID=UPI001C27886C|nr:uncharacterized protein LOC121752883 [Salvia splendens]
MVDFAETIEDCRLLDPGFDGSEYTWAKNWLFERLDRVLVSETWTRIFEATMVTNLPRVSSDQGSVLARCKVLNNTTGGRAFRFQNMWIRHEGFADLVQDVWDEPTGAGGLINLEIKLARIKKAFKRWNKEIFGNIHSNLKSMEDKIAMAQAEFEADPTPVNRIAINKNIANYILLLGMEEDYWRQKATHRWLAEGDKNTRFYQSWVRQKSVRLRIHSIHVNGRELTDEAEIKESAVEFYKNLLAPDNPVLSEPDLNMIQKLPLRPHNLQISLTHQTRRKSNESSLISQETVNQDLMGSRPPSTKLVGG